MKKRFAVLLFLLALTTGLFAQTHTVSAGVNAGVGLPIVGYAGFQAAYELRIIPQLSAGVNAFIDFFPAALLVVVFTDNPDILSASGIEGQLHWYPFSKMFHVDAGLGWGYYMGMNTLLIAPGVGWKIDFGKPGGFIFNPGVRLEIFSPLEENIFKNSDKGVDLVPWNFGIYLNLGYSF